MSDSPSQPTPARGTERMPRHGHLISHEAFQLARERRENRIAFCRFAASRGLTCDEMLDGTVDRLHELLKGSPE